MRAALLTVPLAVAVVLAATPSAMALTPESPEVKALVAKAITYLNVARVGDTGRHALIAYTMLKAGSDYDITPEHPKVANALQAIRANPDALGTHNAYDVAVAILFLILLDEVDESADYRSDVQHLQQILLKSQKPHGGWGYIGQGSGDTSQTQYAVLALWELERAGYAVPDSTWEGVCNWLLRTQDPSGAWGYQGKDSGSVGSLVPQFGVRNSLAAGGLGSLYISFDILNGGELIEPVEREEPDDNVPDALEKVEDRAQGAPGAKRALGVNREPLLAAMQRADAWFGVNNALDVVDHKQYFLYAYERYRSFREKAETGGVAPEAAWYDEGVKLLEASQSNDGCWLTGSNGAPADTCFAVLFLLRSSGKSIKEKIAALGGGSLIGGHGLPANADELRERGGRIRPKPMQGPAEALLAALEDADNPELESAIEGLHDLVLGADDATLSRNAERLRRLAAEGTPAAKIAAIQALAKTRNLDDVPLLIHLLTDENWDVAQESYTALRFMSRRFVELSPDLADSELERERVAEDWKSWYLAVRPDAVLDE
jgi:hypothetical protein